MAEELNKGILYSFLSFSAFISVILLISVLKPHRLYKKILSKVLNKTFKYNGSDWKIYHLLFIVIGLYGLIFVFLQMEKGNSKPEENDSVDVRMVKLGQKWRTEMNLWLSTLILVCLISVYKNAGLFTKEEELKKEIEEINKQLNEIKKE